MAVRWAQAVRGAGQFLMEGLVSSGTYLSGSSEVHRCALQYLRAEKALRSQVSNGQNRLEGYLADQAR